MKVLSIASFDPRTRHLTPLVASGVEAGFPSHADDHIERAIDLNEELIKHPAATFFVRVSGYSMTKAGIFDGDTLVVDRALEPVNKKIVVAMLNGEFTVKRIVKHGETISLQAEADEYENIMVTPSDEFEVWGVVTNVIHPV